MTELGVSLERMSFAQLLLLLAFVASYALAVGGLFGPRGRWRSAAVALAAAIGVVVSVDPWVHGALLVGFVIAGLGAFVIVSGLLAWLVGPRAPARAAAGVEAAASTPAADTSTTAADTSTPPSDSTLRPESVPAALGAGKRRWPKLARRALR